MSKVDDLLSLNLKFCTPKCDVSDLNPAFVDQLILLQKYVGFQLTITSAYRSQDYERSKGRKGTSSHCRHIAVDVSARDSHTRFKVVVGAALANICRIGIGDTFVHLDIDETKPHPIIFTYYHPQET